MADFEPNGATILLVDDDLDALQLLSMVLQRAGYTVLQAHDGESALHITESNVAEIETIVLDLMMPGHLDGYDVCDRLKESPRTRSIPIIVLSAKTSTTDMARSYAAGAFQHITKPYDIQYLLAVISSMVRLRQLERESVATGKKYQAIVDNSPLEMLLMNPEMRIVEMNRTFHESFPDAKIGDDPLEIIYDQPLKTPDKHPARLALQTGEIQDAIVEGVRNGQTVYRRVHAVPLRNEDGHIHALVGITEDVTKQIEMEESLRRQIERHNRALQQQDLMAEHLMNIQRQLKQKNRELEEAKKMLETLSITDDLTGLFNKRHYNQIIEREARRASRYGHSLSLLMMDIDHFKQVNDVHGHPAGNVVLKEIGEILTQQLRDTDSIVRYGGEEFVAVLPETDARTANHIGERLRNAIENHVFSLPSGKDIRITISIGASSILDSKIEPEQLLERADNALYAAKNGGRNMVISAEEQ